VCMTKRNCFDVQHCALTGEIVIIQDVIRANVCPQACKLEILKSCACRCCSDVRSSRGIYRCNGEQAKLAGSTYNHNLDRTNPPWVLFAQRPMPRMRQKPKRFSLWKDVSKLPSSPHQICEVEIPDKAQL
jgi:hypothetical protein